MSKGTITNKKTGVKIEGTRTYDGRAFGTFDFRIDGTASPNTFVYDEWDFTEEVVPLPTRGAIVISQRYLPIININGIWYQAQIGAVLHEVKEAKVRDRIKHDDGVLLVDGKPVEL